MKKVAIILSGALMLTACQTTKAKLTPEELMVKQEQEIASEIKRNRNYKQVNTESMAEIDHPNAKLMAQSLNELNEVDKKCLPEKLATFDNSTGSIIARYNLSMDTYTKCAAKMGTTVTYTPYKDLTE